jgi:hypothetical protein
MRSLKSYICYKFSAYGGTYVFGSLCKRYEIAEMAKNVLDMQFHRQVISYGRDKHMRVSVRGIICQEMKDTLCKWIHQR